MKKQLLLLLLLPVILFTGCATTSVAVFDDSQVLQTYTEERTTDVIDYYLRTDIQDLTLDGVQTYNSYTITVLDATGIDLDNIIRIQEGSRAFQSFIDEINGNVITLNSPLDYPFTSLADISESNVNMAVDGSVTPVIFSLEPTQDSIFHISRLIMTMTHSLEGDDSKFGNLAQLDKGIVIRQSNGIGHTFFNARDNGELRLRMFDLEYSDKAGGGLYGTSFRRTFAGDSKNGVVIELDPANNDSFQVIIQDDLSGLNSFYGVVQGHLE